MLERSRTTEQHFGVHSTKQVHIHYYFLKSQLSLSLFRGAKMMPDRQILYVLLNVSELQAGRWRVRCLMV